MTTFHSIAYFASNEGNGHFYHYHRAVQKALAPVVKEAIVYVPIKANFAEDPPDWKKWFSPFHNKKNRKKFWRECLSLFRQPSEGKRIFFIEFFGRRDFFLYTLAAFLLAKKTDHFWILYRDDLSIRRKKDKNVIHFCSKLLKWKAKKRFIPLTDSELLADHYAKWFGKKPTVLPILYARYNPVIIPKKEKLLCTWLGSPRGEKGAEEIAKLVQIADPASARIILGISGAAYLPAVKNQVEIKLRKAFLTEEEYFTALEESDLLFLPYDGERYKLRTSGVFVEAVLAGKIPFVKEGSWLAHECSRFDLGELIVDWKNPHFFTHLLETIERPNLIQKLKKMQEAYNAFHGEKNFAHSLQTLLP